MADNSLRIHFDLKIILAETITLDQDSVRLEVGKQIQLKASIIPLNTRDKSISWSSSMPSIASVNYDGAVTALNTGITLITVKTSNGKVGTCTVLVPMKRVDSNGTRIVSLNPEDNSQSTFLKWGYLDIIFSKNTQSAKLNSDIYLNNLSTGKRIGVSSKPGYTQKNNFLIIPAYTLPLDTTFSLTIPKNTILMEDGKFYGEDIFFIFKTAKTVVKGTVSSPHNLNSLDVVLMNSDGKTYPANATDGTTFVATDLPAGQYTVFVFLENCATIYVQEGQINQVTVRYE